MLKKLESSAGQEYILKCQKMFHDIISSIQLQKQFAKSEGCSLNICKKKQNSKSMTSLLIVFDFSMFNLLTQGKKYTF